MRALLLSFLVVANSIVFASEGQTYDKNFEAQWDASVRIKRPLLPKGQVELPRDRVASSWSGPWCSKWSDGCTQCQANGLENIIGCRKNRDKNCQPKLVRCEDIDLDVAPLYCTFIQGDCEDFRFTIDDLGEPYNLGGQTCLISGNRDPKWTLGYRCQSLKEGFISCIDDSPKHEKGVESACRKMIASQKSPSSRVRQRLKNMIEESRSLLP